MPIAGIVAEYNPFHNGHLYQIQRTKQMTGCDAIVIAMSGHFTQRGTAAISDKFARTQMALQCGADLVLELPVPYATASAERFCQAAVSLFHRSGIIDTISFGSENGNISLLTKIATLLENPPRAFEEKLRNYLKAGFSFPIAREKSITSTLLDTFPNDYEQQALLDIVSKPNNILGIEYIKAILHYKAFMKPFTIKRLASGYHDLSIDTSIASATAIRHSLSHSKEDIIPCMPTEAYNILLSCLSHQPDMNRLVPFLQYKLMFSSKEDLYSTWDIPKELIHSLINGVSTTTTYTDLVKLGTSKTYSSATVQRTLLRIVLGISSADMTLLKQEDWIPYIRVLGCKKESMYLLKELKNKAMVPIIINTKANLSDLSPIGQTLFNYELQATKLYHYLSTTPEYYNQDFTQGFIKI